MRWSWGLKQRIERVLEGQELGSRGLDSGDVPEVNESYRAEYVQFLLEAVPDISLDNRCVVIDCANGAASAVAPELFAGLKGTVEVTHASPDGRNINVNCGALHPEVVAAEVKARGASMGMTFDGDADRALFADEHGNVVNGDAVMLACARDLQARGMLDGRYGGGDDDVEHGVGGGVQAQRDFDAARAGGRQVCAGRDAQESELRWVASSRATSSSLPRRRRAMAC